MVLEQKGQNGLQQCANDVFDRVQQQLQKPTQELQNWPQLVQIQLNLGHSSQFNFLDECLASGWDMLDNERGVDLGNVHAHTSVQRNNLEQSSIPAGYVDDICLGEVDLASALLKHNPSVLYAGIGRSSDRGQATDLLSDLEVEDLEVGCCPRVESTLNQPLVDRIQG